MFSQSSISLLRYSGTYCRSFLFSLTIDKLLPSSIYIQIIKCYEILVNAHFLINIDDFSFESIPQRLKGTLFSNSCDSANASIRKQYNSQMQNHGDLIKTLEQNHCTSLYNKLIKTQHQILLSQIAKMDSLNKILLEGRRKREEDHQRKMAYYSRAQQLLGEELLKKEELIAKLGMVRLESKGEEQVEL